MAQIAITVTKNQVQQMQYYGGLGAVLFNIVSNTLPENAPDFTEVVLLIEAVKPEKVY